MFAFGVHVEVRDRYSSWYGQIVGHRRGDALVRVGGTNRITSVPREKLRLHPTPLAMRKRRKPRKRLDKLIVTMGNATGDQFGIATALMMKDDVGVLILQEVALTRTRQFVAESEDYLDGMTGVETPSSVLAVTSRETEYAGLGSMYSRGMLVNQPLYKDKMSEYSITQWDPRGRCRSADVEDFIRASLGSGRGYQVFTLPVDDTNHWYGKLTRSASMLREDAWMFACINARNEHHGLLAALTGGDNLSTLSAKQFQDIAYGTRLVGTVQRETTVKHVRGRWGMAPNKITPTPQDEAISWLLKSLNLNPNLGKKHIVIWARFSGKRGGPHPQHDSSHTGLGQLIELAALHGLGVIIAGDKWHKVTGPKDVPNLDLCTYDLREIWKHPAWTKLAAKFPEMHPRLLQFHIFDHISRRCDGLIHLGMRSGNLEAFALMGHRVFYMEEQDNAEAKRMEVWHSPLRGTKVTGPAYDRIVIHQSPTQTGKYIVDQIRKGNTNPDNQIHPWRGLAGQLSQSTKREALSSSSSRGKGFFNVDLIKISEMLSAVRKSGLRLNNHAFCTWDVKKMMPSLAKLSQH